VALSRSQLIGKKVYNPDGGYVGEIVDIGLELGESQIALIVRTAAGSTLQVEWGNVAAAKDIIILKEPVEVPAVKKAAEAAAPPVTPSPAPATPPQPSREEKGFRLPFFKKKEEGERRICPYCGQPATWIPQYQRWYCYNCQRYLD